MNVAGHQALTTHAASMLANNSKGTEIAVTAGVSDLSVAMYLLAAAIHAFGKPRNKLKTRQLTPLPSGAEDYEAER